jgi:hypothetical protein
MKRISLLIFFIYFFASHLFGAPRYMVSWDAETPEGNEYFEFLQGYGVFESDTPNPLSSLEQNSPDFLVDNLWNYKTYVWLGNQTKYIFEPDDTKPTYRTVAAYYGDLGWSPGARETRLTPYRQPTASISLFREEGTGILKLLFTMTDDARMSLCIEKSTDMLIWTTLEKFYMAYEEIEYRTLPLSGPTAFFRVSRVPLEEIEIIIPPFPWPPLPVDPSLPLPEEHGTIDIPPSIIPDPPIRKPIKPRQTIPERERKKPVRSPKKPKDPYAPPPEKIKEHQFFPNQYKKAPQKSF